MKVLIATDGSSSAIAAAKFLHELNFRQPMDVTLLSVSIDPQMAGAEVVQPWYPEWLEQEQARVKEHHGEMERLLTDRCSIVGKHRRDGHPASEILAEAKRIGAELIVMGARGHSLISRILIGSISDTVATHAECSVLIVRPGDEERAKDSTDRITFAYDGSTASIEATKEMIELGWDSATEISLVSVAPIYDYLVGDGLMTAAMSNEAEVYDHMNECVTKAASEIKKSFPNTTWSVEKQHHVGDAIVASAQTNDSELIVVGDAGHSLLHDWILGSTSKYVLRHATCSVWISRHHRRFSDPTPPPSEESVSVND